MIYEKMCNELERRKVGMLPKPVQNDEEKLKPEN
jgi:hypothetical protein